ncbi:MAG: hypothetical protein F6K22_40115, partial [Okeania sp. SIO2F4]|uniref:hypothetical protein n=1 Tax=Okeania sp. SIO2F4 TaxID=2607790 RepID=UPI001429A707
MWEVWGVWGVWGGVKIRIININWAIISKHGDFPYVNYLITEVRPKYSNAFGNWYKSYQIRLNNYRLVKSLGVRNQELEIISCLD